MLVIFFKVKKPHYVPIQTEVLFSKSLKEECVLCICRHREVLQKPIVCILMDQFYANFMFDFDIKNQTIKNK